MEGMALKMFFSLNVENLNRKEILARLDYLREIRQQTLQPPEIYNLIELKYRLNRRLVDLNLETVALIFQKIKALNQK